VKALIPRLRSGVIVVGVVIVGVGGRRSRRWLLVVVGGSSWLVVGGGWWLVVGSSWWLVAVRVVVASIGY
jgi:hypothetical protein